MLFSVLYCVVNADAETRLKEFATVKLTSNEKIMNTKIMVHDVVLTKHAQHGKVLKVGKQKVLVRWSTTGTENWVDRVDLTRGAVQRTVLIELYRGCI